MKNWMAWALAFSVASGCTMNSMSQGNAQKLGPDGYANSFQTEPVRVSRSIPKNAVVVSDIEADYCLETLGDRADAESVVMSSLQEDALSLGADGIANVEVNTQIANAFIDPCWKQVTATGVAYKLAP
jgi:uncharacterized protein YbjQ (UPF0145 family)